MGTIFKRNNMKHFQSSFVFCVLLSLSASTKAKRTRFKHGHLFRLWDSMVRNDNDEEGFKKERGVRGQCLYTYLELDSKSTKAAVNVVHDLAGWDELSQADSRYAALDEAFNKHEEKIKEEIDPLEESKKLLEVEPVNKKIVDIKEYQRDMMKAMLELVKWSEKNQYVTYFFQLDAVGKSELPCVKAIQESYASKYPDLLHSLTSEVLEETKDKLDDSKRSLEEMITVYMKKIDSLEVEETKIPEIKKALITDGWKFPAMIKKL